MEIAIAGKFAVSKEAGRMPAHFLFRWRSKSPAFMIISNEALHLIPICAVTGKLKVELQLGAASGTEWEFTL